jgi:hypothetical protein
LNIDMSRANKTRHDKQLKDPKKERVRFLDEARQVTKTLRRVRNQVERRLSKTANDLDETATNVELVYKLCQATNRGLEVEIKASDIVRKRREDEFRLMDDQRLRQLMKRAAKEVGYIHKSEAAKILISYFNGLNIPFGEQLAEVLFPRYSEPIVVSTETLRRRVLETMDNEQDDLLDIANINKEELDGLSEMMNELDADGKMQEDISSEEAEDYEYEEAE